MAPVDVKAPGPPGKEPVVQYWFGPGLAALRSLASNGGFVRFGVELENELRYTSYVASEHGRLLGGELVFRHPSRVRTAGSEASLAEVPTRPEFSSWIAPY